MFWWNEAVKVIEATEAVKAIKTTYILRPGKSLLRIPKSSRLLNLALFWCLMTFFSGIMKYQLWIVAHFLLEAVEARPKLFLWTLFRVIKMSTCQDFKTVFKCNLTCIFLSLRVKLKRTVCPRTPCIFIAMVVCIACFTNW